MAVVHETKRFVVTVGVVADWKSEVYLITSKEHRVVEFAHPILLYAMEWCKDIEKQMDNFNKDEPSQPDLFNVGTYQ